MRSDVDTLLVPLLKQLHGSESRTASQTYMLLIIVLILSQVKFTQVSTSHHAPPVYDRLHQPHQPASSPWLYSERDLD